MKKLIIPIAILAMQSLSFSSVGVNIIFRPKGTVLRNIGGYYNSENRDYARFLSDCQYYKVTRMWQRGKDTYVQLENGNIQKVKGIHLPYIQVGSYCDIPADKIK